MLRTLRRLLPSREEAAKTFRTEFHKRLVWFPITALFAIGVWLWRRSQPASKAPISLDILLLLALGAVSLAGAVWLALEMVRTVRRRYQSEMFWGILWTWDYALFSGRIIRLRCGCPACNNEIRYEGIHARIHTDNFLCPVCSYNSHDHAPREVIPADPHKEALRLITAKIAAKKYGI